MDRYDYTIVGAGITGIFLAWQLNKKYPSKKIHIIESNERYGGRILSVKWKGQVIELGAWRYAPLRDKYVASLVNQFGLSTAPATFNRIDNLSIEGNRVLALLNAPPIATEEQPNLGHDIGFIPYMYSMGATTEEILSFITYSGYEFYRDNVTLAIATSIRARFEYQQIVDGMIQLCNKMLADTNDNVILSLGTPVQHINENSLVIDGNTQPLPPNFIVTVQPNILASLYKPVRDIILSSFVPYNAIKVYATVDKEIPKGLYVSPSPLRKIFSLGNRRILIYVDGQYSRLVLSLLPLVKDILGVNVISSIYKYWSPCILFWRPRRRDLVTSRLDAIRLSQWRYLISSRMDRRCPFPCQQISGKCMTIPVTGILYRVYMFVSSRSLALDRVQVLNDDTTRYRVVYLPEPMVEKKSLTL